MDRRQKKLEKKRKDRDQKKKALSAARAGAEERVLRLVERSPFGPCAVSADWDVQETAPRLVSVVVTHRLPDGSLVPCVVLVDRARLGVKDCLIAPAGDEAKLETLLAEIGESHGGMQPCEPLVAQSVVFHALDVSRKLGFSPHPDFREGMFGPRPEQLLETPWHASPPPSV